MSYTLDIDERFEMIQVVYHGELSAIERATAIREANQLLSRSRVRRVLVDLLQASLATEPTHVRVELANQMAHAPAMVDSRLAYLVTPEQEANRIIENMAMARHIAVARFHDRDSAIAWLLDDAPLSGPGD